VSGLATTSRVPERGISWRHLVPAAGLAVAAVVLGRSTVQGTPLHWVDLAFHEAGHIVFSPFGRTLHVLGGTLLQLLVPLLLSGYFLLRRREPIGAGLCLAWAGENLLDISVYMADARDMKLQLVGGGEHDWTQLFYQFGLLGEESVARVSGATHDLGVILMLAAAAVLAALALRPDWRSGVDAWLESLPFPGPAGD
jgi:hypothetical protein